MPFNAANLFGKGVIGLLGAKPLLCLWPCLISPGINRGGFIVTNMTAGPEEVVRFYNGRGTAEQWIKEGKYALNWTRLSCHRFVANRVRLSLFVLAYNLGNFLRRLCLPKAVKHWSLRSVQVKLIKMGGRLVRHSRRLIFQLSEVSVPRRLFEGVLDRIGRLSPAPN